MIREVKRAALAAALVFAPGCLSSPKPADPDASTGGQIDAASDTDAGCTDGDGDGYLPASCGLAEYLDCRDDAAGIHPGAYDVPENGIDEDCLGGASTDGSAIEPMWSQLSANGINFSNGFAQGRLGANAGYVLDELGGAVFGPPNFLYDGPMSERLVGVHVWESFFMYELQTPPVPDRLADGRAVLRVFVDWVAHDGTRPGMDGRTYYTIFPDGRIHVDHDVEILYSDGSMYNTAYVSVDPSAFDNTQWTHGGGGSATVGDYTGATVDTVAAGQGGELQGYSCAYHSTDSTLLGLGYRVPGDLTPAGPRISENYWGMASHHALSLQYDFTHSEPVPLRTIRGDFLLYVGSTGGPPCSPVQIQVQPWLNPARVVPTAPAALDTEAPGDEDGDGYVEGGGFFALDAGTAQELVFSLDTSGALAPPVTSAYRLAGLDLTHDPVVLLDGARLGHGDDYLFQVEGDVGWLFLGVPLTGGSEVTVRAP